MLCSAVSIVAASPQSTDRGPLKALAGDTPISVTIALALPALDEAEKLQQALYTPGDPQFHKFLTADQFVARFAPNGAEILRVIGALARRFSAGFPHLAGIADRPLCLRPSRCILVETAPRPGSGWWSLCR
jgi:hypothetical protein